MCAWDTTVALQVVFLLSLLSMVELKEVCSAKVRALGEKVGQAKSSGIYKKLKCPHLNNALEKML